jgi:hypothetical protein
MGFKLQNSLQAILKAIFIDSLLFIINLLDMIPDLFVTKKEKENRLKRNSILSKQSNPDDLSSAYKTCEFPEPLRIDDPNANIFNEFERAVAKYPTLQTLGVRELLSIDDEMQPNGKSFKKVCLFY